MSARTYAERISETPLYGTRNVLTAFDLDPNRPDVAIQLIKKYSDQYKNTCGLDFMLLGREIAISAESHTAFSEGRYWNTMVAAANAAQPAQDAAQNITIELDNGAYFPKKGMVMLYPGNNRIQGLITNVDTSTPTAPVVTVVPPQGGTLPAVTDGDTLVLITSAWGEGTGQPDSSAPTFSKETYYLQILKDKYGITGSQLTNQTEFTVSEDGQQIGVYNVGMADAEARMLRMQENMITLGNGEAYTHANIITSGLAKSSVNFIQTTKGLFEWATDRGGVDNTVDSSNWTVADFDDIDDYMKSQGDVSPIIIQYMGGKIARRVNSQLASVTSVQNSYDPTSALSQYIGGAGYSDVAARARAVNLTFTEYRNVNRVYAFRELPSLSDPMGLGADGYNYNEYIISFPLANVKDAKTGIMMPNAAVMYKQKDGYSRRLEAWNIKAADGDTSNYNSEVDEKVYNLRSHIGFVMYKPNLTYLSTPA